MASGIENVRAKPAKHTVEFELDEDNQRTPEPKKPSDLDDEKNRRIHRQLLDWYYQERERQAVNRYQMAIDADFYDGDQWSQEDAEEVTGRGQSPLVFNEVAPMVDWMIGTERRTRVDWRILPRAEDDIGGADAKTKVMKYISDVNRTPFQRSRAFSDSVKVGIGWVEDGVRADPTKEIIFSSYESWRYVLWDSAAQELDLSDARYLFRWRWMDLDIAKAIWPARATRLEEAATSLSVTGEEDEEFWYLGQHFEARDALGQSVGRRTYVTDAGMVNNRRTRVKPIEAYFRMPTPTKLLYGDPKFEGMVYDASNADQVRAVENGYVGMVDQIMMRMHVASFTENALLHLGVSPYRHNRFPLTPIWCYRRGRDGLPYGAIRRVRDVQEDLNKRGSKSLFVFSTNQVIAEKGAVDDWDEAREEVDRPDGVVVTNPNKRFEIRRDTDMAKGHLEFMSLDAQKIQRMTGINDENLGRQTNAQSGEAIKARQLQGSVTTTEPFDNLRMAVQEQGQKVLSLIEQFMPAPKVVRLTGERGKLEWFKVNQPEVQADGSVRYLNDITASQADFIVSEQDFQGSLRQAMFDAMMAMVQRAGIDPGLALKLMRMAFEFSDLPNKDEIVSELRKMTGEPDPNKEPTPEEEEELRQQQELRMAAIQRQEEAARLELEKLAAEVRKINAEAEKIAAGEPGPDIEAEIRAVQEQAAGELESMAQALAKAQTDLANRTAEINKKADTEVQVARIEADAVKYQADIQDKSSKTLEQLMARLDELSALVADQGRADKAEPEPKEPEPKEPAPAAPPQATVVFEAGAIQIDAKSPAVAKTVTGKDSKGNTVTLTVKPADGDGT